jgi:hypothetical protein
MAHGPLRRWSMVDRGQRPQWRLTGAPAPGWYGSRWLVTRWGKRRRARGGSVPTLTGACTTAWRWRDSGGASAWDGDGASVMRTRRRRVRGVGIFIPRLRDANLDEAHRRVFLNRWSRGWWEALPPNQPSQASSHRRYECDQTLNGGGTHTSPSPQWCGWRCHRRP